MFRFGISFEASDVFELESFGMNLLLFEGVINSYKQLFDRCIYFSHGLYPVDR